MNQRSLVKYLNLACLLTTKAAVLSSVSFITAGVTAGELAIELAVRSDFRGSYSLLVTLSLLRSLM